MSAQLQYLSLILPFVLLFSSAAPARRKLSAREEVAAATAAWVAALNSRESARITALYGADAVFWGTTSKTIRATPADIADYFKTAPQRPTVRCQLGEQHIRVYGDIAINSGDYTFTELVDGKTETRPARFTFVFRRFRQQGGKWLIVDHHSSRVPES